MSFALWLLPCLNAFTCNSIKITDNLDLVSTRTSTNFPLKSTLELAAESMEKLDLNFFLHLWIVAHKSWITVSERVLLQYYLSLQFMANECCQPSVIHFRLTDIGIDLITNVKCLTYLRAESFLHHEGTTTTIETSCQKPFQPQLDTIWTPAHLLPN
jgi:hypothetical protein